MAVVAAATPAAASSLAIPSVFTWNVFCELSSVNPGGCLAMPGPCLQLVAAALYLCQSQVNEMEAEGETEGEGGKKCACMHVCAHSP